MQKFVTFTGVVCPLDRSNVDTDAIIPKQFLKSIKRTGFGPNLFDGWRYLDQGEPCMENRQRPLNPDFVLNDERWRFGTDRFDSRALGPIPMRSISVVCPAKEKKTATRGRR